MKTVQQAAGDKSLGQRCNTHSAMVLRALEGPRSPFTLMCFVLIMCTFYSKTKDTLSSSQVCIVD